MVVGKSGNSQVRRLFPRNYARGDPRMLSTRPRFHWADLKLHVHAFVCAMASLLVTLLHRHARPGTAFDEIHSRLLAELAAVRCHRMTLAQALGAIPAFS